MPTTTAARLVEEYGGQTDYKFAGAVQVKASTTLTTQFALVNKYEPWSNADARGLLRHHPVAIWKDLSVSLAPRAGCYGRMCTFYGGWAADGADPPKTIEAMMRLHNAVDVTYGGTGDPGMTRMTLACAFDDTMKDIMKGPSSEAGCRPVFYYCFTEVDIVDKTKDSDRFMLTFQGKYTLHGRY